MPRVNNVPTFVRLSIVSLFGTCAFLALASAASAQDESAVAKFADFRASEAEFKRLVAPFFAAHCVSCHDSKKARGDLDLSKLSPDMKTTTSAARWAMLLQKVTAGEMPPKERPRPESKSVEAIARWIRAEMKRADKHVARREAYNNGNALSHALLFDPKHNAPFDAPRRLRRLSPEIYKTFTDEVGKGARGVSQPFSPEGNTIFKDVGAPKLDEPTAAALLRNALLIVENQTRHKIKHGKVTKIGSVPKQFLALFDPKNEPTDEQIQDAVKYQFDRVLKRQPTDKELARFVALMRKNVRDTGRDTGVRYTLAAVFLLPEAIYRSEVGGPADQQGRARLAPREIAFALAYALTDKRPEKWLLDDAAKGKLDTKAGVASAVRRMLNEPKIKKTRVLRYFQEYFGYDKATEIFKDQKSNPAHDPRVLVADTDRLIEYVLEQDKNVLYELLTTNKSFVAHKIAADLKKRRAQELVKFEEQRKKNPKKYKDKKPRKIGKSIYEAYNLSDFPEVQPVELPKNQRAGILTQPAWLVANSTSDDNHAIFRGKWVRERLLGGVVPDIPITVDAQLPHAPEKTLRQRMMVTQEKYCWQCHRLMNPVGLPFEQYDHLGRYREREPVLDPIATAKNVDMKGKPRGPVLREAPLDAKGRIDLIEGQELQADVDNAVDMIRRLASSEYVEQVFVRHAFRYWMGRNETLGDARSLQAAHKVYKASGSMRALIVALLSSDSFLYRAPAARAAE